MGDDLRPDIAAAAEKMSTKVGGKRELRKLEDHLHADETVMLVATGTFANGTGILAMTDRRLLFLKDGVMSKTSQDFSLSTISSIVWHSGMLMGKISISAAGATSEITNVNKVDGKAIVDAVRERIAPPAPVSAPTPALDLTAQLQQLAALKDQGILTEEEFAAKKAQILGI